nr:MAG TPA: hypothetical protein [Caudoviricetes sp.]
MFYCVPLFARIRLIHRFYFKLVYLYSINTNSSVILSGIVLHI